MPKSPPFWSAGVHAARRPYLLARQQIAAALRRWFTDRGFIEVETAALQVSPGNETHLHAFATELIGTDGERRPLYLRTSPEFACKKLLAAGEARIVEFAKAFRNRERGPLHHPEFTMLEWYRANEPYDVLMDDCAALLAETARASGAKEFRFRGKTIDPLVAPERRHCGVKHSHAMPASIYWAQFEAAEATARPWLRKRPKLVLRRPPTTAGATYSAGFWLSVWKPTSGSAAPPYYMSILCRWPRWRGRSQEATPLQSVSSSTPAG